MPTPVRVGMENVTMHGHAKQRGHATQKIMLTQRHGVSMPPGAKEAAAWEGRRSVLAYAFTLTPAPLPSSGTSRREGEGK